MTRPRNKHPSRDRADHFKTVARQLRDAFNNRRVVVDGEIIAVDESGRQNLHRLQRKGVVAQYYIFDLLELDGDPLKQASFDTRRLMLEEAFISQRNIKLSAVFTERDEVLKEARRMDLEGVVAKHALSEYYPDYRSPDWLKYKFNPSFRHKWGR